MLLLGDRVSLELQGGVCSLLGILNLHLMSKVGHLNVRGINKLEQVQENPPGWVGVGIRYVGERVKEMVRLEDGRKGGDLVAI